MQNTFKHTPDGHIHINDFICDLDDFLKVEPDYTLPEFFIGREYIQGKSHRLYTERNEIYVSPSWVNGDVYISNLEQYKKTILDIDEKQRQQNEEPAV